MKKIFKISFSVLTIIGICYFLTKSYISQRPTEIELQQQKIANISQTLLQLTNEKQECLDKLSYYESLAVHLGKNKVCSEYDDQIRELKKEIEGLLDRPYKQVWGLIASR